MLKLVILLLGFYPFIVFRNATVLADEETQTSTKKSTRESFMEHLETINYFTANAMLKLTKEVQKINSRLEPMLHWWKSNQKPGRLMSFNETRKLVDIQNTGCGGVLEGLSGEISYESPSILTPNQHSKIRCVWTIRANKKMLVKFQLVADELNDSEIHLNAYGNHWPGDLTSRTKTISSGQHTEFTLEGYAMFVTLVADSIGPVSFTLKYQGIGSDDANSWLYSHYHFTESIGSVDFPRMRGDTKYSPREIATFVINPTIPTSSLRIQTTKVDTEVCYVDTLSHYTGSRNHSGYYKLDAPSSTRNRYCGQLGTLENAFSGGQGTDTFISIFISEVDDEYSGFTFNWTS